MTSEWIYDAEHHKMTKFEAGKGREQSHCAIHDSFPGNFGENINSAG